MRSSGFKHYYPFKSYLAFIFFFHRLQNRKICMDIITRIATCWRLERSFGWGRTLPLYATRRIVIVVCPFCGMDETFRNTLPQGKLRQLLSNDIIPLIEFIRSHTNFRNSLYSTSCEHSKYFVQPTKTIDVNTYLKRTISSYFWFLKQLR